MSENEAIAVVKNEKLCVERNISGCCRDCGNCGLVMKDEDILSGYDEALKALEEIQQYRTIGTVDECRAAVGKQKEMKPIKDDCGHDCCPDCGWIVYYDEWGSRYLTHCENCGQRILWEGEAEMVKMLCSRCGAKIKEDENIGYIAINLKDSLQGNLLKDNPLEQNHYCVGCMDKIWTFIMAEPEPENAGPVTGLTSEPKPVSKLWGCE